MEKLTISLDIPHHLYDIITDRCSLLFHQQLREVICSVINEVAQEYILPEEIDCITLNVGDITLAEFETEFCQRLAQQLTQQLIDHGRIPAISEGTRDDLSLPIQSTAEISAKIADASRFPWPEKSADIENWLIAQMEVASDQWRQQLAVACLNRETRRRVWQALSPAMRRRVLSMWVAWPQDKAASKEAPLPQGSAVSEEALLLAALIFLQAAAGLRCPAPPAKRLALAVFGHEALLLRLFNHGEIGGNGPIQLWLQALWQHPPVRTLLVANLPVERGQRWQECLSVTDLTEKSPQRSARTSPAERVPRWHECLSVTVSAEKSHQRPARTPPAERDKKERDRKRPSAADKLAAIPVCNAGVVVLWPLLPSLFSQLGLWEKDHFINPQAQINAACWLDMLIWDDDRARQERMPFTQWLCGLPLDIDLDGELPDEQQAERLQQWLTLLPVQLAGWRSLAVSDIRSLFLQRSGQLVTASGASKLVVQPEPFDILLNEWPWPLDTLMLPWLEQPLPVTWLSSHY